MTVRVNFLKKILLPLILILGISNSIAQNSEVFFKNYTYKDGLSQSTVYSVHEDTLGYVWIGTQSGLSLFDGNSFKQIKGGLNRITYAVVSDTLGNIWTGNQSGIESYNVGQDTWSKLSIFEDHQVNDLKTLKSSLLIGSNKGFDILDILSNTLVYSNDTIGKVYKIAITDSSYWLATDQGLFTLTRDNPHTLKKTRDGYYTAVSAVGDDIIAGTDYGYVERIGKITQNKLFQRTHIHDIQEDDGNNLWLGTNHGLILLDNNLQVRDSLHKNTNSKYGIHSNTIYEVYKDKSGQMWLGTRGGGIDKFDSRRSIFNIYKTNSNNEESIKDDFIWCFTEYDKEILIGTNYKGIQTLNLSSKKFYSNPKWSKFSEFSIQSLLKTDDHDLWVGTEKNGLFQYDRSRNKIYKRFNNLGRVKTIELVDSLLFFGGKDIGFIRYNRRQNKVVKKMISDYFVYTIKKDLSDDNTLWIGTIEKGLFKYDIRKDSLASIPLGDLNSDRLKDLSITFIYQDTIHPDYLIIGTNGQGLYFFNKSKSVIEKNITYSDGLSSNTIYAIEGGSQSDYWITTNGGICRMYYEPEPFSLKYQVFDDSFGLESLEFNGGAIYNDQQNKRLYLGSTSGLICFNSDQNFEQYNQPIIKLMSYKTNDNYFSNYEYSKANDKLPEIKVSVDDGYIELQFRPIDNSIAEECIYTVVAYENNKVVELGKVTGNKYVVENLEKGTYDLKITAKHPFSKSSKENELFVKLNVGVPISRYIYWSAIILFPILVILSIVFVLENRRRARNFEIGEANSLRDLLRLNIEASKSKSDFELAKLTADHLLHSPHFQFDFVKFYKVDYLNQKIICTYSKPNNDSIDRVEEWFPKGGIDFSDHDIIADSIDSRKLVYIKGNIRNGNDKIDINAEKSILKKEVYLEYGHQHLERWFVPLIERLPDDDYSILRSVFKDKVLGLVEAGFHNSSNKKLTETQLRKLELYLHSNAETLNALNKSSTISKVENSLKSISIKSSDDYEKYIDEVLVWLKDNIKLSKGYVFIGDKEYHKRGFVSLHNMSFHDINSNSINAKRLYGIFQSDDSDSEVIVSVKNHLKGKAFYGDSFELEMSEVTLNIMHDNFVIGYAKLFGDKYDFFNEENLSVLEQVFDSLGEVIITKKYHSSIAGLISPFNVLKDLKVNLDPVIKSIENYFFTDMVDIWLRNYDANEVEFQQRIQSEFISKEQLWIDLKQGTFIPRTNIKSFTPINVDDYFEKIDGLEESLEMDRNGVKKIVHVPLIIDKHKYGFINVYLKYDTDSIFKEDKQFLKYIASKTVVSMIQTRMITSFYSISESLVTSNEESNLYSLAKSAYEILHCEPVILFQCDSDGQIDYEKIVTYGVLKDKTKIEEARGNTFIDYIVAQDEETYWFESKKDLPEAYLRDAEKINDNFWDREKIQSSVVIKLKHDNQMIGVMFFNYRIRQTFGKRPEENINGKLIRAFATLAVAVIVNTKNISLIKEQQEKLELQASELKSKNDEVMIQMENMLPYANANSLMDIIRAVNHDIRNHLLKVDLGLQQVVREYPTKKKILSRVRKELTKDIVNSTTLIDLFEPNSFKLTVIDLDEVIRDVASLFEESRKNGVRVNTDNLNCDKSIRCSRSLMGMIIYNLVSNARKAIEELWNKEDGHKEPERRKNEYPSGNIVIKSGYKSDEKFYFVEVADDGIGIDNKLIDKKIYEVHFTTSDKGKGIGLYFVKRTIEEVFGGEIFCKSTLGRGTTFRIMFKQQISNL